MSHLAAVVAGHPYPSFDDATQLISPFPWLWAEYSEENHACCERMYINLQSKDFFLTQGRQIYERGGLQALVGISKILVEVSPLPIQQYLRATLPTWFVEIDIKFPQHL